MAPVPPPAVTAPASRELRRELDRVGRRARLVLTAGALVAALALDVWYGVLNFVTTRYLKFNIYFPAFFLVAFAVLAARIARSTRVLPLGGLLDRRHELKSRLAAAVRYRRRADIPADLREAQARETLRAVDFARLRAAFRFRPWAALAWLVAGVAATGGLMYRYPEFFNNPRSVVFRQGRVVFMTVRSLGTDRAPDPARAVRGEEQAQRLPDDHPLVVPVPDKPSPKPDPSREDKSAAGPQSEQTAGKPEDPRPERGRPDGGVADTARTTAVRGGGPGEGRGSRVGPNEGGSLGRPASLEETRGISPPTERPEAGLAAAADLREPGSGSAVPSLPFVRLLGGRPQAGVLFDPETLNIVLEAYPPKYRAHLEAYLKALQSLGEERGGS